MLVHRFSIRPCRDELADARDRAEIPKTAVILNGKVRVMATALAAILRSPLRFVRTLRETLRLHAPLSDRGLVAHLAYLAEACVLLGELRRRKIGHLHAHFGTNPAAVALGWRRTDCRIFSFSTSRTRKSTAHPWRSRGWGLQQAERCSTSRRVR